MQELKLIKTFAHEPKWLELYREKNAQIVKERPLKKHLYFNLNELNKAIESKEVNSNAENVLPKELEKLGLKVMDWKTALQKVESELQAILENEQTAKNQFEAFINANFNSGFIVIVPKNFDSKKLIELNIRVSENCIAKNIFLIEENIQGIKISETIEGQKLFCSEVIKVKPDSEIFFVRTHNEKGLCFAFQQTIIEKNARLQNTNLWIEADFLKGGTINALHGQGANIQQFDLILSNKNQKVDLNQMLLHIATDSTSFSVLKNVLFDESKNVFDGMIKILPSGQRTNALLQAHSILLSENASSNNSPGLEIEADDVKATHSASVEQIDEEQLFYLQSRGVNKLEAKQMIVLGFLESMVNKIHEEFHEKLFNVISSKWKKIQGEKNV